MFTNKKYSFFIFYLLISFSEAQNIKDSLYYKDIDDIIITGQYSPQTLDKSIYQIEIISEQDIKIGQPIL